MVCFFLSLLKRKLPQRCPKHGGGVKATLGQCPKGSSFFFQDYFPRNPSYKMNLKMHYSSGLPTGAINSARHEQTVRIPAYRRVDIGFSKVIKDGEKGSQSKYFKHFESLWLSAEVFNLLGIRNTISYLWVTDVVQNQYAVPNYLTSRLLNLKLQAKF